MSLEKLFLDTIQKRLKLQAISEGSAEIYKQAMRRFPPSLLVAPLDKVTRKGVEEAVMDMATRLAPKTVRHALSILVSVLNEAVDDGVIPANPAVRIRTPKARAKLNRNVGDKQLKDALFAASRSPAYGWLFRFALGSGLRRGELCALTWGDIDFATGVVSVTKQVVKIGNTESIGPTKTTSSVRTVTLPPALIKEAVVRKGAEPPTAPVFKTPTGKRMTLSAASVGVKHILDMAGLPNQTLHSLRHTHVSQLVSSGLPLPAIAQRVGHSSVQTTMSVYAHASSGEDAKAAAVAGKSL
jgi:integrase